MAYLVALIASWLAVLSVVMVFSDAAPGAVAFFPSAEFAQNLPQDAGIVGTGPFWVGVRSDAPGLGLSLYRAGAWLVLPAGLPGCLPLARVD